MIKKLYRVKLSHEMVVCADSVEEGRDVALEFYEKDLQILEESDPSIDILSIEEVIILTDLPSSRKASDQPWGENENLTNEQILQLQKLTFSGINCDKLSLKERWIVYQTLSNHDSSLINSEVEFKILRNIRNIPT